MFTLSIISGLALPWLLAAAGAGLLPVVIHLAARRRLLPTSFPAARLVHAVASQSRRSRTPRDLLLMLIRGVLLAALVLAAAQPAWTASSAPAGPRDLRIVIDASASMTRVRSGQSLFEEARARADAQLAALTPGVDRAAVVLARRTPSPLLPALTTNIDALRAALRNAVCTIEHADMLAAVDTAASLTDSSRGVGPDAASNRVLVLSDMQGLTDETASTAQSRVAPAIISWSSLRANDGDTHAAVLSLRLHPVRPVPGEPVRVEALVRNTGAASRRIVVLFESPGTSTTAAHARLAPQEETWISAAITFPREGRFRLTARVNPDPFAHDDARHAVVHVQNPAATIVTNAPDSHAAACVIAAVRAAMTHRHPAIAPSVEFESPAQLTPSKLAAPTHIVLLSPFALDAASILALRQRESVTALAFDEASAISLAALLDRGTRADQPATTVTANANTSFTIAPPLREAALALDRMGLQHTPLSTRIVWPDELVALGNQAAPLLILDNHRAALLADPTATSPTLNESPWFPVLIARMLDASAAHDAPAFSLLVGETLPAGDIAATTGFHETASENLELLAVNLDPRESAEAFHSSQRSPIDPSRTSPATADALRIPLWPWLVVTALVAAAFESLVIARTSRPSSRSDAT